MSLERKLDRQEIINELQHLGVKFHGNNCKCPFHNDKNPSSWIFEGSDGWKFHCSVCQITLDVYDLESRRTGKELKDVLEPIGARTKPVKIKSNSKVYPDVKTCLETLPGDKKVFNYFNPEIESIELVVIRQDSQGKKTFKQMVPCPGGFKYGGVKGKKPIYNRMRIMNSDEVVVVEGEKCVHALHELGIVATTSPGGASNGKNADWSLLAGKTVYLWPDNDKNGFTYIDQVQKCLEKNSPETTVKIVNVESLGLKEKGDVYDYIQLMQDVSKDAQYEEIRNILSESFSIGLLDDLKDHFQDIFDGKFQCLDTPIPDFESFVKMTYPGTVTVLCGEAGGYKSFFLLYLFAFFHHNGEKVALYELEEDKNYWYKRLLAIVAGNSKLLDLEWIQQNQEEVKRIFSEFEGYMENFDLYDMPDEQLTHDQLFQWCVEKAESGCTCIGVDPVTALEETKQVWTQDKEFIFKLKGLARRTGCRFYLVTHPKSGKTKEVGLDSLAGGAAYSRFPQTVLWLKPYETMKEKKVIKNKTRTEEMVNKEIGVIKARNGKLFNGKKYGMMFDANTFCWKECGFILK